ncbi:MAG: glycosyltransferase family 2 protein [Chloroflexia bacterium]|nr:glycosyltransferase family 2 protein [Chloroflexia bacterium]
MNDTPSTVYVIIPNYNTVSHLCRCLDSLRTQQGVRLEIFVVDNASSDGSAERVRSDYGEVHLLVSPYNGGFAYAVNMALRQILELGHDGPSYVLLLNPDTEVPPQALQRLLDFIQAHPEAGAVGPKLLLGNGQLDLACRRSFPSAEIAFYRLSGLSLLFPQSRRFGRYNLTYLDPDETADVDSLCGAFMLVPLPVVEQVGLLDESFFMYGEDLDWAYRIKQHGYKIYYFPQVEVLHWKRVASSKRPWASLRHFYQAMRLFYRKHYAPHSPRLVNLLIETGISLRQGLALAGNFFRRRHVSR